ncbi:mitochondrial intermediate peptidase, mitochondrial [Macadamia integrifolia]|uniref:mitochondrial intermediate peptidase, mitochondrial n=1 Tax=Macadamia integrifolia TaxID=60698 RepID=UPI001C4F983B|nr:mitochondrial intermediate peptidase, mitochondrial [Macadamia integrifolia]
MSALKRRNVPIVGSKHLLYRTVRTFTTRRDHFYAAVAPDSGETGLYGFEILKTPKGFQRFVDEAIERSSELISYVSGMPSSTEIIRAMDEISDTVCSVVDSAELCRNTHPDRFVSENEPTSYAFVFIRFSENIVKDPGSVDIFPASRIPRHIQHILRPIYRSTCGTSKESMGSVNNFKEKGFRITTDPGTLSSVLQWASDDEVRKQSYIQGNSVPRANLGVLDKLIASRHELAQIMGYKSYAEFAVHPNMASSPVVAMSFLLDLSKIVRPKADEEFKAIKIFKESSGHGFGDLEPWDEAYFTGMMKSSTFKLDSSVVASYFPLSQCIEGLKVLVESLFGATFRHIPLAAGESWHPDVLKMALHHPEEGGLGYLYLDLYSRKGKYPGCAHFAIKGGRQISETEFQLPVVALVCNFSASRGSSSARLNHWEVETLFHEFGHALHSLLSRTDYQHFSGTRVALDLAETPANLFEYYAWDYRVLKTFARHYSTGEVIPQKLVESMNGARNMFAATELQRQIFYALIDQTLFGEQSSSSRETISIVADLKSQYTSWKHVEGTHWHTRFNHLVNYGAGYYSYLYAKCFAASIWKEVCLEDPLSMDAGSALRAKFLQHGGARDPSELLKDLVGDGVLRHSNGGIVPDIDSLCEEMKLV